MSACLSSPVAPGVTVRPSHCGRLIAVIAGATLFLERDAFRWKQGGFNLKAESPSNLLTRAGFSPQVKSHKRFHLWASGSRSSFASGRATAGALANGLDDGGEIQPGLAGIDEMLIDLAGLLAQCRIGT